jgi:hypothetical protein
LEEVHAHALACAGRSDVMQHRDLDSSHLPTRYRAEQRALAVCERCPMVQACRDFALRTSVDGVAGGLTRRERIAINPDVHDVPALPVSLARAVPDEPGADLPDYFDKDLRRCSCGSWCTAERPICVVCWRYENKVKPTQLSA